MQKVIDSQTAQFATPTLRTYLEQNDCLCLNGSCFKIEFGNKAGLLKKQMDLIQIYSGITEAQLQRHMMSLAKEPLKNLTLSLAKEKNLQPNSVTIRNQKSRWGSCSARGTISLNWRLILMPDHLQTHIILHELAHMIHPNHSADFWNLLNRWDAEFETNKRLLRKMGKIWISLGQIPINDL
jgi:predicted metal-dependent hydrolase